MHSTTDHNKGKPREPEPKSFLPLSLSSWSFSKQELSRNTGPQPSPGSIIVMLRIKMIISS